jgi:ring-1,2-phenylacetyl-CoA epoxidase subunit PaaC
MTPELREALTSWLLAHADDQLILAHRSSEWTGHAPILEEDIALANIAQDELGHAIQWYGLLTELRGEHSSYPDQLVYERGEAAWRNCQLVELPNGDWAFTMLRQYLLDVYEHVLLEQLEHSQRQTIAAIAAKIRHEELYHLRHSSTWVRRLALGTDESHRRMQAALDIQWPYVGQLFTPLQADAQLVEPGYIPSATELQKGWLGMTMPMLTACSLIVPETPPHSLVRECHTPHLGPLLNDLQQVARLDPQAIW